MQQTLINNDADLKIAPSETSSALDFDFLVGKWKIYNRKLKTRLNDCTEWQEFEAFGECRTILNGSGNVDSFRTEDNGAAFEGMTLRLFNPKTRLWSIYWADSNAVVLDVPQIGSFENKIGHFFAKDVFQDKEILVRFEWDASDADVPVWSQAFSPDNGQTWEWNWEMSFHRRS